MRAQAVVAVPAAERHRSILAVLDEPTRAEHHRRYEGNTPFTSASTGSAAVVVATVTMNSRGMGQEPRPKGRPSPRLLRTRRIGPTTAARSPPCNRLKRFPISPAPPAPLQPEMKMRVHYSSSSIRAPTMNGRAPRAPRSTRLPRSSGNGYREQEQQAGDPLRGENRRRRTYEVSMATATLASRTRSSCH